MIMYIILALLVVGAIILGVSIFFAPTLKDDETFHYERGKNLKEYLKLKKEGKI